MATRTRKIAAAVAGTAAVAGGTAVAVNSCSPPPPPPATLPTAPASVVAPSTIATVTVPASWAVTACPSTHAATVDQNAWETWLSNVNAYTSVPDPTHAPVTKLKIVFPSGCYYTATPIDLDTRHALVDIEVDAKGATVMQTNTPDCQTGHNVLQLANPATARVEIDDLTVTGSAPATPAYCGGNPGGIQLSGVSDVALRRMTVSHVYGDGVYIGGNTSRALVDSTTVHDVGRTALSITSGSDLTITNNTVADAAGFGASIETNPNNGSVSRVLVQGNRADRVGGHILWNATASDGTTVSDVWFDGNLSSSPLIMFAVDEGTTGQHHRVAFTGNSTDSTSGQIQIYNGDQVTVTGNQISNGPPTAAAQTEVPPIIYVAASVCGTVSANTYSDGSTAQPFRVAKFLNPGASYGYSVPTCP